MYYFTVDYSTIYYSTTTPAVCISETDLRRFTQNFTILLVQYCTILLCTNVLLTIPLFTILSRPQPFASRKPTCAGSPRILLFYYFTILLLFYHDPSRLHLGNRPAPVHPEFYYSTILLFYYFTILLFYYFTILLFYYYSTTTPAVCISETDLRQFTQDFTILLVRYCTILLCTNLLLTIPLFTILPRPQPFASRKPTCAGSPRILLFYYFTILLFYYFTIILPRPQPFASRKPTCAGSPRILLFY